MLLRNSIISIQPFILLWGLGLMVHCSFQMFSQNASMVLFCCCFFFTSIVRKRTITGLYTSQNTFVPKVRKIGLVSILLDGELSRIQKNFESNVYTTNVIKGVIDGKIRRFKEPVVLGPNRYQIYLQLPWLSRKCQLFVNRISAWVAMCYNAVKLHTLFQT